MWRAAVVVFCAAASAVASDTPVPEHVAHLARIRAKIKRELSSIPDYVCLAVVDRFVSGGDQKITRKVDTLRFDIAHFAGRELHAWPGDEAFREESIVDSVKEGLISTGDLYSHSREIFLGSFTDIRFAGSASVQGIDALKWDFCVPKYASTWTLMVGHAVDKPASEGSFWADPSTDDVLRFELRAVQTPHRFPARDVVRVVEYSRVKVGERNAWLPKGSEFALTDRHDRRIRNVTTYSNCRKFTAKSDIRYAEPGP